MRLKEFMSFEAGWPSIKSKVVLNTDAILYIREGSPHKDGSPVVDVFYPNQYVKVLANMEDIFN